MLIYNIGSTSTLMSEIDSQLSGSSGEQPPKDPKTQQLDSNAPVFWNAHGIFFIDYLEKGQTINSDVTWPNWGV